MSPWCRSRDHTGITGASRTVPAGGRGDLRVTPRAGAPDAGSRCDRPCDGRPRTTAADRRVPAAWRSSCVIVSGGRTWCRVSVLAALGTAMLVGRLLLGGRPGPRPWPACPATAAAPSRGQPLNAAAERPGHDQLHPVHEQPRGPDVRALPPGRARGPHPGHAHAGARRRTRPTRPARTTSSPSSRRRRPGRPTQAAPHLAALTRYAQCMRSHDISHARPDAARRAEPGQRCPASATTSAGTRRSSGRPTRPAATTCPRTSTTTGPAREAACAARPVAGGGRGGRRGRDRHRSGAARPPRPPPRRSRPGHGRGGADEPGRPRR